MQSFQDAAELLATARRPDAGKPLCNNTRLYKRGDNYAVALHKTDVVTYRPDGAVVLDSGTWQTVTTKERINSYSPANLWQSKGVWYVDWGVDTNEPTTDMPYGKRINYLVYHFQDGMVLMPDQTVLDREGNKLKVFDPVAEKRKHKFRKRVNKYAKDFIDRLYDGKIPMPSAGDCMYCGMREVGTNKPMGELSRTPASGVPSRPASQCANHIESHVKERYFVPSLLVNALEWRGSQVMKWTVGALMRGEDAPAMGGDYVRKEITDCVRRYCYREMGMPS